MRASSLAPTLPRISRDAMRPSMQKAKKKSFATKRPPAIKKAFRDRLLELIKLLELLEPIKLLELPPVNAFDGEALFVAKPFFYGGSIEVA